MSARYVTGVLVALLFGVMLDATPAFAGCDPLRLLSDSLEEAEGPDALVRAYLAVAELGLAEQVLKPTQIAQLAGDSAFSVPKSSDETFRSAFTILHQASQGLRSPDRERVAADLTRQLAALAERWAERNERARKEARRRARPHQATVVGEWTLPAEPGKEHPPLALAREGKHLAIGSQIWLVADQRLVRDLGPWPGKPSVVVFSPDGSSLGALTRLSDSELAVLHQDVATGESIHPRVERSIPRDMTALAISPDRETLVFPSGHGTRAAFLEKLSRDPTVEPEKVPIECESLGPLCYSADGRTVFAGQHDLRLVEWTEGAREVREIYNPRERGSDPDVLHINPNGQRVQVVARNGTVGEWNLTVRSFEGGKSLPYHTMGSGMKGFTGFTGDGKYLLHLNGRGSPGLYIRETATGNVSFWRFWENAQRVGGLVVSPDGEFIAVSYEENLEWKIQVMKLGAAAGGM